MSASSTSLGGDCPRRCLINQGLTPPNRRNKRGPFIDQRRAQPGNYEAPVAPVGPTPKVTPDNRPSRALSPANWHSTTTAYLTEKDSTRPARAAPGSAASPTTSLPAPTR